MSSEEMQQLPDVAQAYSGVDVEELVTVTARLTELLNIEVQLLDAMNITGAGALQDEKQALTKVLEAQKRYIESQPEVMDDLSDMDRARLTEVATDFDVALQRNVRLVAVAKAVNQRVVQAIKDTLAEQNSIGSYTRDGVTAGAPKQGISISLNEKI